MAKWADWCITRVRFNARGTHIDAVRACQDNVTSLGPEQEFTRQQIVSAIENRASICTVFRNPAGKWVYGAPVEVLVIDGEKFIKTERDSTRRDNLDNLPTF